MPCTHTSHGRALPVWRSTQARERRFVYAGLADRLAHPRHQVGRLWEHWGRPEVLWYKGGHVAFARTKAVGRFVRGALESSGLTG